MQEKNCPICSNVSPFRFKKKDTAYFQCSGCKVIFCDELDNSNMVGGGWEVERNTQQNHIRIARIDEMTKGCKKEDVFILDWGCGTGYLIEDLIKAGYVNTFGYDTYNPKFERLPEKDKFHIVISVECFEHMASPYMELNVIYRSLKIGGACQIETGFSDTVIEDGQLVDDWFYVNPEAGHSTIHSHHSLDLLMAIKGFIPYRHFNRNVRLYTKK